MLIIQRAISMVNSRAVLTILAFAALQFAAGSAGGADRVLAKNLSSIVDLAFSDDGQWLVAGTNQGNVIRVWEVASGRAVGLLEDSPGGARVVGFLPGSHTVAAVGWYRGSGLWMIQWDVQARTVSLKRPKLFTNKSPEGMAIRPDGMAVSVFDSPPAPEDREVSDIIRTWELATGKEIEPRVIAKRYEIRPALRLLNLTYSPDGKVLATVIYPNIGQITGIKRFDMSTGRALGDLTWQPDGPTGTIAFRRDGKAIGVAEKKKILVIDLESRKLSSLNTGAESIAFRPNGQGLAFGNEKGAVGYWDFESQKGRRIGVHEHNDVEVTSVAFSPDGQVLASGDRYGEIRLWDLKF